MSLDALRGFDMLFIMGFASLVVSLCALWPCGVTDAIARSMSHVAWDGLRHHDTIFPLFLFLAGVSFPFSLAKQRESGRTRGQIYLKIVRRGVMLVLFGLIYNGLFSLDFSGLRCASVLGRIGIAWMLAALLYVNFGVRTRAVISVVILAGYALLSKYVGAPDAPGADPLSREGCLVGYVDRCLLPGRLLYDGGRFDPEGLLNPGVIFNDDPRCHLSGFKPLPLTDPLIDRCIECGFCEVNCLSYGLTLSSRQRIVVRREIARLERSGEDPRRLRALKRQYRYAGAATCAGDGLCSLSCPLGINTGELTHAVRGAACRLMRLCAFIAVLARFLCERAAATEQSCGPRLAACIERSLP